MSDQSSNKRILILCAFIAIAMFGFGYALVPLYDIFCEVTGLQGKVSQANDDDLASVEFDPSRLVTVQFDANVNSRLNWHFKPAMKSLQVRPGELIETHYVALNKSNMPVVGQASYNVAPGQAAIYFSKTECFCFTKQLLQGNEQKDMPLRFMIDPELPPGINTITMSYTFYQSNGV